MIYGTAYELPAWVGKIRSIRSCFLGSQTSLQFRVPRTGSRPRLTRARSTCTLCGISIPFSQRVYEKPKPLQSDTFLAVPVSRFRTCNSESQSQLESKLKLKLRRWRRLYTFACSNSNRSQATRRHRSPGHMRPQQQQQQKEENGRWSKGGGEQLGQAAAEQG